MKSYAEYKPTGLKWLPEVPAHWDVRHIGELFSERKTKVSDKDFAPLSVTRGGIVPQMESVAKSDDGDNRKLVREGDFVINSRSDRKSSSGVSDLDGSVSLVNIVLTPRDQLIAPYVHHLLKSFAFAEEFYRNGHGIVADLWTTRYSEMKSISLPVPPPEEQAKIVSYLDAKTAKIDKLIKLKEREIELLQEKKQAVISHVVTRGLDPNVELVDSGVPGLAKIPSHWRRRPLKAVLETPMCDGPHTTPEFVSAGIPFVSAEAAHDGRIFVEDCRGLISRELHCEYCRRLRPQRGDIFIVKSGSTTGKTVMVDTDEEFSVWSPLALVRTGKKMNNRFLFNYLTSIYFQRQVQDNWSYGTQPNIGMGVLRNLYVIEPPKKEQNEIVSYLDKETSRFGGLISMFTRQIALLKEYRTRLISDAVTGKIDLREVAG